VERRGWVIRAGTIMGQLETGGARRFRWGAAALRDGTSRVMGDCQARICEGLGVKFPGSTRLSASFRPVIRQRAYQKADRYALEESDRAVLSMNQTNKEERSSAEPGEKRARAKENIVRPNTCPTQSGD
jgi:hypothetical protein